jgi:hypothetical protein
MSLKWFWEALDLSDNLARALNAVRGVTGIPALILAAALAAICYAMAPLVWYFDIGATYDWTANASQLLLRELSVAANGGEAEQLATYAAYAAYAVTLLTLLPTLVELFAARFAQAGITFAAWLVFTFCVFDMVTDYPRVAEFTSAYQTAFDTLPLGLGFVVFWVLRIGLLIMASFGFEVLFVIFFVCTLFLFWQFNQARGGAQAIPAAASSSGPRVRRSPFGRRSKEA